VQAVAWRLKTSSDGCLLTIVGGGREAWVVCGRGTQSILRARGRWLAWVPGPSASPLDGRQRMRFQLVIQLPGGTFDLDALVALKNGITRLVGSNSEVNGYYLGDAQRNIFVLTNSPEDTFARVQPLLLEKRLLGVARIAYRNVREDQYTVLWPESFSGKFVVA
jgi:hypothetical protein